MDAANSVTRSKVIVQYTDPNGLFDQINPLIDSRLPLGSLHWKSPSRPLRSIDALDVSFIKEESQNVNNSTNIRRHQIPGLRQTPFVKLLLIRCDDKETYKEKVRKEVKQWVKDNSSTNTSKGSTKGQERHDASEHLILHVVVPGTSAASQPRSAKQLPADATDSTESINSKSKWTGKSSSTVYDKLRADFHGSSKSSLERVAQIRIPDANGSIAPLTTKDNNELWDDFIDKLKAAILQSFDIRVAQYEDDIQEREKQRSWPGWNFCTFFILKEGLAKGFENMGLLEDALAIYEELDAGLDLLIQDQATNESAETTGALLPYSKELKDILREVLDGEENSKLRDQSDESTTSIIDWVELEKAHFPLRLERRDYQQMILRSEVSALDFRVYIFIRQSQIMFLRARVFPASKSGRKTKAFKYDANMLAEICEKSVTFLNFAARALRQDLYAAWGGHTGLSEKESNLQANVIDNITMSWKWSATLQIMSDCQVVPAVEMNSTTGEPSAINHTRTESELTSVTERSDISKSKQRDYLHDGDNGDLSKGQMTSSLLNLQPNNLSGRIESWAFWSGELFSIMRAILTSIMVSLEDGNHVSSVKNDESPIPSNTGSSDGATSIQSPSLSQIKKSQSSEQNAYKLILVYACKCSITANRLRASREVLALLARIEEQSGDFETAISWLAQIPSILENEIRTDLDASVLNVYGRLLKQLGRSQDYAQYLLLSLRSLQWIHHDSTKASTLFQELLSITADLRLMELPFSGIFATGNINHFITHQDVNGGFGMPLTLKLIFPADVQVQANVRLVLHASGSSSPSNLSLTYNDTVVFGRDGKPILLSCPIDTSGWYEVVRLEVQIGKLCFVQQFRAVSSNGADEFELQDPMELIRVYIYPNLKAPLIIAKHSPTIDLSSRRSILFEVATGEVTIINTIFRVKPATAGLRLDIQSATATKENSDMNFEVLRIEDTLAIRVAEISNGQKFAVQIPYSLDATGVLSVDLRCELDYEIDGISHQVYEHLNVSTTLPVNVKVQDTFRDEFIISRFTISPATLVPVSVVNCDVTSVDSCEVIPAGVLNEPMDIFSKQSAHWLVKLKPQEAFYEQDKKLKLQLRLKCYRFDEMLIYSIRDILLSDLSQSSHKGISRLLVQHLTGKAQTLWSEDDLEAVGLTHELQLWSFEEMDWKTILLAVDREERKNIIHWLQEWHRRHSLITINVDDATPCQVLQLPMEIAPPSLRITTSLQPRMNAGHFFSVGETICTDLRITCSFSKNDTEMLYEVIGQADTWLVGGQRRATFSGSETIAVILLVAQKTGQLLLPSIEVRCRHKKNGVLEEALFEVEHLSATCTMQVITNVKTSTIGFGRDEAIERNWLVASERR